MPFRPSFSVSYPTLPPLPEGVLYRLGNLPPEFDALEWPTLPTTSSEVTVSTLVDLQTAIDTSGTRVIVDGTISGTATIRADDVDISGTPGSSVGTLNIERNRHRIRVRNLGIRDVSFSLPAQFNDQTQQVEFVEGLLITDVVFDNVVVNNPTESAFNVYGRRVVIMNSDVTANWYSIWAGPTGNFFTRDLILANNSFNSAGPEATVRIFQNERNVTVDCVLTNGLKHNWRLHQAADLSYCGRNTFEAAGIMLTDPAEPGDTLGRFWFEDNLVNYTLVNGVIITLNPYTRIDAGTISGNVFNMPASTNTSTFEDIWSYGVVPGDWDLSGNVVNVV